MAVHYERVDDEDPDVAELMHLAKQDAEERFDRLDPLALFLIAEELNVNVYILITSKER